MIRVLTVDGQAQVRWGLRMRLAVEPDLLVVGEAGTADEALALARTTRPDVIVVDLALKDADGVNLVRRLRAAAPGAGVVVLTLHADEHARIQALQAGARAFLEKSGGAADLLQAIRDCAAPSPTARLGTHWLGVG